MARLVVTVRAALDTAAIVAMLTDNAGAGVAMRYRREIDALYERRTLFPESGMRRSSLGHDIRIGVVEPYGTLIEGWYANDRCP